MLSRFNFERHEESYTFTYSPVTNSRGRNSMGFGETPYNP